MKWETDSDLFSIANALFLPLLSHTSQPYESHYFPLQPGFGRPILVHSHASAPYVDSSHTVGHTLTMHSSGECWVDQIKLTVDWWATVGRWGTRYGPAAVCWAVGIMAILLWDVWKTAENGGKLTRNLSRGDYLRFCSIRTHPRRPGFPRFLCPKKDAWVNDSITVHIVASHARRPLARQCRYSLTGTTFYSLAADRARACVCYVVATPCAVMASPTSVVTIWKVSLFAP